MEKGTISLSPGDHIFIQRSIHYSHHGIYVGDDKVIHYQTPMEKNHPDPSTCRVIESDLDTFLDQDKALFLYRYGISEDKAKLYPKGSFTSKPCDDPEIVVKRARKSIEEGFSHYNIVGNNCEDFATYCKTGQRSTESAQFSAALECVAAARCAADQGYRSPIVYAGCVFGMFTARDFKYPPKNPIPATSAMKDLDDEIVSSNFENNNNSSRKITRNGGGVLGNEAKADINADTQNANGNSFNSSSQQVGNICSAKPKYNCTSRAGTSKAVNFDLHVSKRDI